MIRTRIDSLRALLVEALDTHRSMDAIDEIVGGLHEMLSTLRSQRASSRSQLRSAGKLHAVSVLSRRLADVADRLARP